MLSVSYMYEFILYMCVFHFIYTMPPLYRDLLKHQIRYNTVRPWTPIHGIHNRALLHEMAWNQQLTDQIFQNNLNAFSPFLMDQFPVG